MSRRTAFLLAGLVLAPAAARAAGAEPPAEEVLDFFLKWLNLALVFGLIWYFGRDPIRRFFSERRASISDDLSEAAKVLGEAERRFAEWERRMAGLDAELAEIERQAAERAEAERARILADAEAAVQRVRRDSEAALEQEVRRARAALRAEAAELAVQLARDLLRERISDADRARLVDDFVTRVGSASAAPATRS